MTAQRPHGWSIVELRLGPESQDPNLFSLFFSLDLLGSGGLLQFLFLKIVFKWPLVDIYKFYNFRLQKSYSCLEKIQLKKNPTFILS